MFITKVKHEAALAALEVKLNEKAENEKEANARFVAEQIDAATKTITDQAQQLFEAALAADRAKRQDSAEPFVEIVSETFSEEGGVNLRLDWNLPFINYLKKNGFSGPSDEAIVDNWLVSLSRERIAEGSDYK